MDYIGSKEKLINWIMEKVFFHYSKKDVSGLIFLDACSGSGAISKAAINRGFTVYANDLLTFPRVIICGYRCPVDLFYQEVVEHVDKINNLSPVGGFFYQNYSENAGRTYFTNLNAKIIDATRKYIRELDVCCQNVEKVFLKDYLLYCSLKAMTRVLNTTGVQAAFLKKFKPRSLDQYKVKMENYFCLLPEQKVYAFQEDIFKLLRLNAFGLNLLRENILYIDPPYNNRQYGPNYHLYETFVKNDNPTIIGKTGIRKWQKESKSKFCSKSTCLSFLEEIIKSSRADYVMISYNSDGLLLREEMENMLRKFSPEIETYSKVVSRYKADNKRKNNNTELLEYLFAFKREYVGEQIF